MSATTAETIVDNNVNTTDNSVKPFTDKGPPSKNGYLTENNSKEYFLEIVKESIKEEIPEDDEEDKASTNLVVGKIVEIKEELDVNSEMRDPTTVLLINGCSSGKESVVNEDEPVHNEILSVANKTITSNPFEKTEQNVMSCNDSKLQSSPANLVNSSNCKDSLNSFTNVDDSDGLSFNENCLSKSFKKEAVCNSTSKEESQTNTTLDNRDTANSLKQSVSENFESSESTNNALVNTKDNTYKLESSSIAIKNQEEHIQCKEVIISKEQQNFISSELEIPSVKSNCSFNNNCNDVETITSRTESTEEAVCNDEVNNQKDNTCSSIITIPKNKEASEITNSSLDNDPSVTVKEEHPDIQSFYSENTNRLNINTSPDTLPKNNPIQDISSSSEEVASSLNVEAKKSCSEKENKPDESHPTKDASSSQETTLKEVEIINETKHLASSKLEQLTDLEKNQVLTTYASTCKNAENLINEQTDEQFPQPAVSPLGMLTEKNELAKSKRSVEVSSSKSDGNINKLGKSIQKRPPTPDSDERENSKKLKLSDNEYGSKKRSTEEHLSEYVSDNKKLRLKENITTVEIENDVIVDGVVTDSTQESEVEVNKENNENNHLITKNEEKKKDKMDDNEKSVDVRKLNKDKLKKKDPKTLKDKKEKDISDIKSLNLTDLNETNNERTSGLEKTSENEDLIKTNKLGMLKLKKNKSLDQDEELINGTASNTCPLCSCSCKLKKNDRKILGEKTRTFVDTFDDNSENININLVQKLEELVGQTVADWASNKCDVGIVRKRSHFLEEEHDRLIQLTINLKKQLDDARCIMKRMIDEKIAQKSWAEGIIPLKVTRSVGLQVCTTGSAHVLIKAPENEKELPGQVRTTFTIGNTTTPTSFTKTNHISTDTSKISNGAMVNSFSKDLHQKEISRRPSGFTTEGNRTETSSNVRPIVNAVVVNSVKEGASDQAKLTSQPSSAVLRAETKRGGTEDDLEVQVIEPATDKENSSHPVVNTPTICVNTTLASFTSSSSSSTTTVSTINTTTAQITPAIYVLKPSDVMGGSARNARQVTPTSPSATSASEVIDLTDNDSAAWATPKTTATTTVLNRLGGPSPARTPTLQAGTLQNSSNFNVATNTVSGTNKVVTFPADSTTTYVIQRPNNTVPPNTIRKAVTPTTPQSGTEMMLTSLSSLPPLPRAPKYASNIAKPPKPILRICKNSSGIMLSWNFDEHLPTTIRKYQVYAYQEGTPLDVNKTELWKKVGDVDALPLPMACTLTQFKEGHKYFFIVRAMDVNMRLGEFSLPGSIMLTNTSPLSNTGNRV